jgi:putative transposase
MIQKLAAGKTFHVKKLCQSLGASSSGYYQWKNPKLSPRQHREKELSREITVVFQQHKGRYGSPRIGREMNSKGVACSPKTVARIMKRQGLKAFKKQSFRPKTTIHKKDELLAPKRVENVVAQNVNEVWVSEITYIPLREGWLYLAAWMDLCSRKIVGWEIQPQMKTDLVQGALNQGIHRRVAPQGLLLHSDRGSQYTSRQFHESVKEQGFIQSMAACGYCYDNAHRESFWSSLKNEALPEVGFFEDAREARLALFEYIEGYYNRRGLHSSLGYQSPESFEQSIKIKSNTNN